MIGHPGFTLDDQQMFAELSGDWNPIHVDPVTARRLLFGEPVVHGLHLVLWSLDQLLASGDSALARPARINALFKQPVLLGRPVEMTVTRAEDGTVEAELRSAGELKTELLITPGAEASGLVAEAGTIARETPHAPDFPALEDAEGALPLMLDRTLLERAFPALARHLESGLAAALLASTRLIGMRVPGLHSLYSELDLEIPGFEADPPLGSTGTLGYRTALCNSDFRTVELDLGATRLSGALRAFVRPAAAAQLSMADAAAVTGPARLHGRHDLIIGGSRGLGEVAAKLVAAAGAEVALTYAAGQDDAERVVDEIRAAGGRATTHRLDVLDPDAAPVPGTFTHLSYFAAPRIKPGSTTGFDQTLFDNYFAIFGTAFARVLERQRGDLTVLYPSTVYIEAPEKRFSEYAAAKAAGETLCAYAQMARPGLSIAMPRLPRMKTDQTQAILGPAGADPATVLWPHLA